MQRSTQILLRFCIDEIGHVFHLYLFVFRGIYDIARRCVITSNGFSLSTYRASLTEAIAVDLSYRFFINETGGALSSTTLRHWVTEFLRQHVNGFRLGNFTFSDRRTIFQAMINCYLKYDGMDKMCYLLEILRYNTKNLTGKLTSLMRLFNKAEEPLVQGFVEDCGHSSRIAHEGYLQTPATNFLSCKKQMSGQIAEIAMARQQVFSFFHCFPSWEAIPPGGINYLRGITGLKQLNIPKGIFFN